MKILMLTTNSSLMDGVNRHILTVATAVNQNEHIEVAVCTVFPRAELNFELERTGVKTYTLNAINGHDKKIFIRFFKLMKEYKPDIVHCHVLSIFERIILATFFRNTKYMYTAHGITTNTRNYSIKDKIEVFINNTFSIHFTAISVVSNGVREHIYRDKGKNIYTIYNPIVFREDIPKNHLLHNLIQISTETPIIGTACRIADVKNPISFTKVMCRVLQLNKNAHAVVMGDGCVEMINRLKDIVTKANVEDRFHWLGYRQDAPELVRDLNCFVMTSISEGMPTSILESMANKTPFAMMEGMGGLNDIADINVKEGPIGIIVPKDDIEGMAKEICSLLDNPEKQKMIAENSYSIGKKHFDVESVSEQLYNVYKKMVENK